MSCPNRRVVYSGCGGISAEKATLEREMNAMMEQAMSALRASGYGGQVNVSGVTGQRPVVIVSLSGGGYLKGYAPDDQSAFDSKQETTKDTKKGSSSKPSKHFLGHFDLVRKDGHVMNADKALRNKVVALYFSAHWCNPCCQFTPVLAGLYKKLRGELEVVFVSSDRSEQGMFEFMRSMHGDWLAIPYNSPTRGELSSSYGVNGIPCLIVVKPDGSIVSNNAVNEIYGQGEGAFQQWKRHFSFEKEKKSEDEEEEKEEKVEQCDLKTEVCVKKGGKSSKKEEEKIDFKKYSKHFLGGVKFVNRHGQPLNPRKVLRNKVVALYFSAHCAPCRRFTPKLVEFFDDLSASLSVVFVSVDISKQEMLGSMKEAHGDWAAIDYDDPKREELEDQFGVNVIPCLVVVKSDGTVVTKHGVDEVCEKGIAAFPEWKRHFELKKKGEESSSGGEEEGAEEEEEEEENDPANVVCDPRTGKCHKKK